MKRFVLFIIPCIVGFSLISRFPVVSAQISAISTPKQR